MKAKIEKYVNGRQKLFMTLDEALLLSRELAKSIRASAESPDLVLGIANGGLLVAKIVADELNVPLQVIKIQRTGSVIKMRLGRLPGVRRMASIWHRIPILNYPLVVAMSLFRGLSKNQDISIDYSGRSGKILVIDDAIDSGQTMTLAVEMLRKNHDATVTTAVLARAPRLRAGRIADFYICNRIHHFPWSGNSPSFRDLKLWINRNNLGQS